MQDFEKLGAFYLGREYDVDRSDMAPELLLYDAKDLTTHAICVGMTGSGKTGLCVTLLEEAAIDGIPALVIDPKGDMGNLMLQFPELRPADFEPWVEPGEAARKGMDASEFAAKTAELWRNGIGDWGQDGARIRRLQEACEVAIYTPASRAGRPLTVLRSFEAPPQEVLDDAELFAERLEVASSGLLALMGRSTDLAASREATFLSNVLSHAWREGRSLSLADLIRDIQSPPFDKLGVMDLDSFFPAKERTALAMALNNLVASPGFAPWLEGEPLEIPKLLYTPEGKPRLAVLSIAHLSEAERMFFVTILLSEVVAWMRTQAGTSSLRALLYMDEIFGYFPPSAEPPAKRPMLTLLKQARAYGLGVVLATQNPVDLDYKGLSNTGTWFIGRLQTERDKARLLDGLEGAMADSGTAWDRQEIDELISNLDKRVFFMRNVHDARPSVFHTRWALSYLRGPLTRQQIQTLMAESAPADAGSETTSAASKAGGAKSAATAAAVAATQQAEGGATERPALPDGVRERFREPVSSAGQGKRNVYRPALYAPCRLHFVSARAKVDLWRTVQVIAPFGAEESVAWDEADIQIADAIDAVGEALGDGVYAELPAAALRAKSYKSWASALKRHLYESRRMTAWKVTSLKLVSEVGEERSDFVARVRLALREKRDVAVEKLKTRYATKFKRQEERIRKAEQKIDKEEEQYERQRKSSWISAGTSLLGSLLGRKVVSRTSVRRAGSAVKAFDRASKEKADIERAQHDLEAERAKLADLEAAFEADVAEREDDFAFESVEIDEITIRPRKTDIGVGDLAILWSSWTLDENGIAEPGWGDS